jgi:hypothetical protein
MRFLRAYIQRVLTNSTSCVMHRQILDETTLNQHVEGEYPTFRCWIDDRYNDYVYGHNLGDTIKASFGFNDPELYEKALSLLECDVLLTLEGDKIIAIRPVQRVPAYCCGCNRLRLPSLYEGAIQTMEKVAEGEKKIVTKESDNINGTEHIDFVKVTTTPCKECLAKETSSRVL